MVQYHLLNSSFSGNSIVSLEQPISKINFDESKRIIDIQCGLFHSVLLSDDGLAFGFGFNSEGSLGNGLGHHQSAIAESFSHESIKNMRFKMISCGGYCTALLNCNSFKFNLKTTIKLLFVEKLSKISRMTQHLQ
jgi:alpha-tubulin suppressor-like RCC1 family protein